VFGNPIPSFNDDPDYDLVMLAEAEASSAIPSMLRLEPKLYESAEAARKAAEKELDFLGEAADAEDSKAFMTSTESEALKIAQSVESDPMHEGMEGVKVNLGNVEDPNKPVAKPEPRVEQPAPITALEPEPAPIVDTSNEQETKPQFSESDIPVATHAKPKTEAPVSIEARERRREGESNLLSEDGMLLGEGTRPSAPQYGNFYTNNPTKSHDSSLQSPELDPMSTMNQMNPLGMMNPMNMMNQMNPQQMLGSPFMFMPQQQQQQEQQKQQQAPSQFLPPTQMLPMMFGFPPSNQQMPQMMNQPQFPFPMQQQQQQQHVPWMPMMNLLQGERAHATHHKPTGSAHKTVKGTKVNKDVPNPAMMMPGFQQMMLPFQQMMQQFMGAQPQMPSSQVPMMNPFAQIQQNMPKMMNQLFSPFMFPQQQQQQQQQQHQEQQQHHHQKRHTKQTRSHH
jgi:hypothetical protein